MGGGSINKLTLLLQEKIVTYDTSTIDMFRMWVDAICPCSKLPLRSKKRNYAKYKRLQY